MIRNEQSSSTKKNVTIVRPRLNTLLTQAVKKPLTVICAGMGCGKTQAVYDFSLDCGMPVIWVQLSESDNISSHYWENSIRAVAQTDASLAEEYKKLGFPDSEDKMNRFIDLRKHSTPNQKYLLVFDDFHCITSSALTTFFEQVINSIPENRSLVLITREFPQINISKLMVKDQISIIEETDLNFTEEELYHYLLEQDLVTETNSLSRIYADTRGWAFIISFVARMLKKTPGYAGYVQNAIKQDISKLIESEVWNGISQKLRLFLLRLSLTDHRSLALVELLAQGDESLIADLNRQNAFVRFDRHIDFFHIHTMFIDFLQTKQNDLSDDDTRETYRIIAAWCLKNDFVLDALLNYEKIGDYLSIMLTLNNSSPRFIMANVSDLLVIFNRMPETVFDSVELSASMHIQMVMNSGDLEKTVYLLGYYEKKYLLLPEEDPFRNRTLSYIYYQWGVFRMVMSMFDDRYDFDVYFTKALTGMENYAMADSSNMYQHPPGMWTSSVGCSRAGALQAFSDAMARTVQSIEHLSSKMGKGLDNLCQGEQHFYQGDLPGAKLELTKAIEKAQADGQYEIIWRTLFYLMRIAISQGDYESIAQALKDMTLLLDNPEDSVRYMVNGMITGWYCCVFNLPQQIPSWLKERFTFHVFYANTLENFGNHIKAKYCYMTKNYATLLEYIEVKRQRPAILFERIELLALEACARYKMKDSATAFRILQEAYLLALPDGIEMPFIELGKDMHKLLLAAETAEGLDIRQSWLKSMKQKAAAYSRKLAAMISEQKKAVESDKAIALSPREIDILQHLTSGRSRAEIAEIYGLSVNTIKVHINSIYKKLNARNRADIYRIASELMLLK